MVFKFGKMAQNTKVIGDLTKPVVKVNFGTSTEMFSKVNGWMIRLTDTAFTFIKMVQGMKVNGKTIYSMVKGKKFGPITPCMKAITTKERSTVRDFTFGRMDPVTKETGLKIESKELEFTNGRTAGRILDNGRIITCMEKEFIPGQMVGDIKANTKWIKNMDTEFTSGQMAVFMKATG